MNIPTINAASDENVVELTTEEMIDQLNLDIFDDHWEKIQQDYQDYAPDLSHMSVRDMISNSDLTSPKAIIQTLINIIFFELKLSARLLGQLIVLSILSAFIKAIQDAFQSKSLTAVVHYSLMLLLMGQAIHSFMVVSDLIVYTIDHMHHFMVSLLPLVLMLMSLFGNILSVAFFHPIIIFFLHLTVTLIHHVFIPLLLMALILYLVSQMNDQFRLTKLADLIKKTCMSLLVVCLSIFLTILSAQGASVAIQDGLVVKTTRFMTSHFVPVVGRMFAEATETVLSVGHIVKNGLGLFGLLSLLLIVGIPIVKVAMIGFIYKLAAAILQPIGEERMNDSLTLISENIFFMLAFLLVATFMFVVSLVVLLMASNISLMVR